MKEESKNKLRDGFPLMLYFTYEEVMYILGVSRRTLHRYIGTVDERNDHKEGLLKITSFGYGLKRISRMHLFEWIAGKEGVTYEKLMGDFAKDSEIMTRVARVCHKRENAD